MRHLQIYLTLALVPVAIPALLFWKRGGINESRQAVFNDLYDVLASVFETAANLKPEWAQAWEARQLDELPPRFRDDAALPERTLDAVREKRFARALMQRHRWRSVRQPLFTEVHPVAWAALQRRLQIVSTELIALEEMHRDLIREDEADWISRAVEGFDNARSYLRAAERADEPIERQVANLAYVAIHLAVQLSDRLVERQCFELSNDA